MQLVAHVPLATLQMYGAQADAPARAWQTPAPLQTSAVAKLESQRVAPQLVPATSRRHAPFPSQVPSRPQLCAASTGQSLRGSLPFATSPQTPSAPLPLPAAVQLWQSPLHALLQQTPSTQLPDAQSAALLHI